VGGITQAEDPRERSCEERIWIQAGGSGNDRIFMLNRYCSFNLISCGMVNTVMGNRTFARCDTKSVLESSNGIDNGNNTETGIILM